MEKNTKNNAFFYKEWNRMQRTPHSFIKNGKECKNVAFFWKERMPNPVVYTLCVLFVYLVGWGVYTLCVLFVYLVGWVVYTLCVLFDYLVGWVVYTLCVIILWDGGGQGHPVVIRNLGTCPLILCPNQKEYGETSPLILCPRKNLPW